MSFGSEMQELASEIIQEFAEEQGKSKLFSLVGEGYNTDTGQNAPTYVVDEAYMTEGMIKEGSAISKSGAFSGKPFEFFMDHRQVTVAGSDLTILPKVGDIYNPAGTVVGYEVIYVDHDMFKAAYHLYVMKKPVVLPTIPTP